MDRFEEVVSLAKRRGFVYPGSEIYGGLANTYDYGPLGVELLRNIRNLWWDYFVTHDEKVYGLETNILMNRKVWEASGHTKSFNDVVVECRSCNKRTRADHLIEDFFKIKNKEKKVEGFGIEELERIISEKKIPCPYCKEYNWTKPQRFNLLFRTHIGIIEGEENLVYLRGEIAQGMFVNFKNVLNSLPLKLPFGLAQSGAAFRNEITLGRLVFRTLQFNLSEIEYFFDPQKQKWEDLFIFWKKRMWDWATKILGLSSQNLRWRIHTKEERAHYSQKTEDLEYKFPWGFSELYGIAYRTDYDLRNHMEKSGVDLRYIDQDTKRKFIPHVIEPTFGMDRTFLAILFEGYTKEKDRIVLRIKKELSPFKVAVFPLLSNKKDLVRKAREVFEMVLKIYPAYWDDRGNIGKRYFYQDEIGTPWCITIDFQTLEDKTVTVRDRDSKKQERVAIDKLPYYFENQLNGL